MGVGVLEQERKNLIPYLIYSSSSNTGALLPELSHAGPAPS